MSYDNVLKFMVEADPQAFVDWLLPESGDNSWRLLDTELKLEPIRADTVFFLQGQNRILHLEFQTTAKSEPPMPFRMLDYWVRLHRQYQCDIEQVVIYLKRTESSLVFEDYFQRGKTFHPFRVIRLWEVEASLLLNQPFLLPLAVLAKTSDPESLLATVAQQVDIIKDRGERSNVVACIQLLAGINFAKSFIRLYLREELMQESVVYQSIVAESMQKGERQGLERGLKLGLQQGLQQGEQLGEATLILRLLTRRFGTLSKGMTEQIRQLGTIQLESLGEALLDFTSLSQVEDWLARQG
ncbi:MAG: Rpn family recombination-promoting nuclease/putative transposase [Microcystaceae cyanobacterium]